MYTQRYAEPVQRRSDEPYYACYLKSPSPHSRVTGVGGRGTGAATTTLRGSGLPGSSPRHLVVPVGPVDHQMRQSTPGCLGCSPSPYPMQEERIKAPGLGEDSSNGAHRLRSLPPWKPPKPPPIWPKPPTWATPMPWAKPPRPRWATFTPRSAKPHRRNGRHLCCGPDQPPMP